MVIVITGATGLLGRNILFEYMKENRDRLDALTVFILGRAREGLPLAERIRRMVMSDGLDYLSADAATADRIRKFCGTGIRCMDASVERPGLGISPDDLAALRERPVDHFFHAAALTDLRPGAAAGEALERVNVRGAAETLRLAAALNLKEFCHISTAYVCGRRKGVVAPDSLETDADFRNPYEASKAQAEKIVRDYAARTGTRCRYFRPSILCGRLLEAPPGAVVKFDAFYAWAAFFLAIKMRAIRSHEDRYTKRISLPMRLCVARTATLNIVPVDYAAKMIHRICADGHPDNHFHLANPVEMPPQLCIAASLGLLGISGVRTVETVPARQTTLERLYYRTAGALFTPYVTGASPRFNLDNTRDIARRHALACPPIDGSHLSIILEYAKRFDFGVRNDRSGPYPATARRRGRSAHSTSFTEA